MLHILQPSCCILRPLVSLTGIVATGQTDRPRSPRIPDFWYIYISKSRIPACPLREVKHFLCWVTACQGEMGSRFVLSTPQKLKVLRGASLPANATRLQASFAHTERNARTDICHPVPVRNPDVDYGRIYFLEYTVRRVA